VSDKAGTKGNIGVLAQLLQIILNISIIHAGMSAQTIFPVQENGFTLEDAVPCGSKFMNIL
jgi:hypothetical protein